MDESEDEVARKAEIEDIMRTDRMRYWRDESLQREYRDILEREETRRETELNAARGPGPFDAALKRFRGQAIDNGENSEARRNVDESFPQTSPGTKSVGAAPASEDQPRQPSNQRGSSDAQRDLVHVAQNGIGKNSAIESARLGNTPLLRDGVDRVTETQGNVAETRKGPIQQRLKDQLEYAAEKTGIQVEVHSGGQPSEAEGGLREGSPRHDHGHAADLKLYETIDDEKRYLDSRNPQDRAKMKAFIQHAVTAGATGVGHGYMGTRSIHVGGGSEYAWGRKGHPPLDWVKEAHSKGLAAKKELLKHGGWPHPTKPAQGIARAVDDYGRHWLQPQEDLRNWLSRSPPEDRAFLPPNLSLMRNMINTDMMLRKMKK